MFAEGKTHDTQSALDYIEQLNRNRERLQENLDRRRDWVKRFVDRWHDKCSLKLDTEYTREIQRIKDWLVHKQQKASCTTNAQDQWDEVRKLAKELEKGNPLDSRLAVVLCTTNTLTYENLGVLASLAAPRHSPYLAIQTATLQRQFATRNWDDGADYIACGISLASKGEIIVTDFGLDQVGVFSECGKLLQQLSLPSDSYPSGAVKIGDSIVVACQNGAHVYSSSGKRLRTLPDITSPRGIALSRHQDLIISEHTDAGNFILIMDGSSFAIKYIISSVAKPEKTSHAEPSPNDSGIFDGSCLGTSFLESPDHSFNQPLYIAISSMGQIIISDSHDDSVKVFNRNGTLHLEFGGRGIQPGKLCRPMGVCVDAFDNILVADSENDRVQIFDKYGEFLGIIVSHEDQGLIHPTGIATDRDRLLVLQADGHVCSFKYMF